MIVCTIFVFFIEYKYNNHMHPISDSDKKWKKWNMIKEKVAECSQTDDVNEWQILLNEKSSGMCICYNATTCRILYLGISGCKKIGIPNIDPSHKNSLLIEYLRTPVGKEAIKNEYLDLNMEAGFHRFLLEKQNELYQHQLEDTSDHSDMVHEFYDVIHPMEIFITNIRHLIENFGFYSGEIYLGKILEKELLEKEILEKEILEKEILEKEILEKEILEKELLEKKSKREKQKINKHNQKLRYKQKIKSKINDSSTPTVNPEVDPLSSVDLSPTVNVEPGIIEPDVVDVVDVVDMVDGVELEAVVGVGVDIDIGVGVGVGVGIGVGVDESIPPLPPIEIPDFTRMNMPDLRIRFYSTLNYLNTERDQYIANLHLKMYQNEIACKELHSRLLNLKHGISEYKKDFAVFRKNLDEYLQKIEK